MMFQFSDKHNTRDGARELDVKDTLRFYRELFELPKNDKGEETTYLMGHSLGPIPKTCRDYVNEELDAWRDLGAMARFVGINNWRSYAGLVTNGLANIVGARLQEEVIAMNGLTVNLHLMLASFYRPKGKRFKILIEASTFPSDQYAVKSQARFRGYDPSEAIVTLKATDNFGMVTDHDSIIEQIGELGDSLALVLLGNSNYASGQALKMKEIAAKAHEVGALCGFDIAHGIGNLVMNLHDDEVDFAVWCTYKYLCAGSGSPGGIFIHEKHLSDPNIPRFEGWWGTDKLELLNMNDNFDHTDSAESWQLTNPPILQFAALRSAIEICVSATVPKIRAKGDKLTAYAEWLLQKNCGHCIEIITPPYRAGEQTRGNMISVRYEGDCQLIVHKLYDEHNTYIDYRKSSILRIGPSPIHNSFEDIYNMAVAIKAVMAEVGHNH